MAERQYFNALLGNGLDGEHVNCIGRQAFETLGKQSAFVVWSIDEFNLKRKLSHENLSHKNPEGNDQMNIVSINFLFPVCSVLQISLEQIW